MLNESSLQSATDWLCERDPVLVPIRDRYGYPPLWAREPGFEALLLIILEQQVSLASAKAAFGRLQTHTYPLTPHNFLKINDDDLFQIGFSRQKKGYARGLAEAILNGEFVLGELAAMPDASLRPYMKKLKGIGDWTVDIYALMCLLRPDILPRGDIALYEAFRRLYKMERRPHFEEFEENTQHWRPWRSVGARLLWHFYLCERKK